MLYHLYRSFSSDSVSLDFRQLALLIWRCWYFLQKANVYVVSIFCRNQHHNITKSAKLRDYSPSLYIISDNIYSVKYHSNQPRIQAPLATIYDTTTKILAGNIDIYLFCLMKTLSYLTGLLFSVYLSYMTIPIRLCGILDTFIDRNLVYFI